MKTEIYVNDKFRFLSEYFCGLPERFESLGTEIYRGRNDVRVINFNGQVLAVKYFKKLTLANRYIYATVRKSKARRAYEHTEWLLGQGISSPENVAYINCYKFGMLHKSYYISLYSSYKPLKDMLSLPISESEEGLKAFARFTYKIHKAGVFHHDYSINNVLYSKDDNQYDFSLIDNNRLKTSVYSFRKGMKNLNRMAIPVEGMGIVAAEYARASGANDLEILNAMTLTRLLFQARIALKRWLKAPLRLLKGIFKTTRYGF